MFMDSGAVVSATSVMSNITLQILMTLGTELCGRI